MHSPKLFPHSLTVLACLGACLMVMAHCARGADPLERFDGCRMKQVGWSDGDSFPVKLPDGREVTIRLYGVDCIEIHTENDASNARRLLDQRRWFGIKDTETARQVGEEARDSVASLLSKPFTVHTAFADARGDPRFSRVYGFVTTPAGEDLAEWLVERGLARAFGVCREKPDGTPAAEWKEQLRDLELLAAKKAAGAWRHTDWDALPKERQIAREEEAEIQAVMRGGEKLEIEEGELNVNTASRDELMALPGIGEVMALRIIEGRPYKKPEDLLSVPGIGEKSLEKIRPFLDSP